MSEGNDETKEAGPATWRPTEHPAIHIRVYYVATPPKEYTVVESQGDTLRVEGDCYFIKIVHPGTTRVDATLFRNPNLCVVEEEFGKWVHPDDIAKAAKLYIERKAKALEADKRDKRGTRGRVE